jgi:steroid delta-isomerase-like uncharacterized protein
MSIEENKAVVRRHSEEFWNQKKLEVAEEIHAADYVFHDATSPATHGSDAYNQFATTYWTAFPDLHFTAEALFAEGDLVAQRWTATGTHQGELIGIPPTGKQVTNTGISIFRITDGKIVEEWVNWSTLSFMQQLGVIPPIGEGAG